MRRLSLFLIGAIVAVLAFANTGLDVKAQSGSCPSYCGVGDSLASGWTWNPNCHPTLNKCFFRYCNQNDNECTGDGQYYQFNCWDEVDCKPVG